MELKGKIHYVGELETITGRDGQAFNSRTLVIATDESYPHLAVFQLRSNIAADFTGVKGQTATVYFDFAGCQSKNNPNNYYCKLTAWRVEI